MTSETAKVNPEKLTVFTRNILGRAGLSDKDAGIMADILVATDLRGIDSHGVGHLAMYARSIMSGRVNPDPKTMIYSRAAATAIMDGDKGPGFVVGHRAMTEAINRAYETGAGFVTVRNSSHFGAGGNYAMMALKRDMIGISMTIGGKGMVVPGSVGQEATINVLSIAVPSDKEAPFVLDMATTVVAAGKVEIAMREGKPLPEGWAVDKQGKPITDPKKFYEEGALLPMGGSPATGAYKGFGLAVAVDILCRILSGAMPTDNYAGSHFFGALKIDGFMPVADFKKAMDGMIQHYRSLPKAPGVDRIYVSGEIEQEIERKRKQGIPLHPAIIKQLRELAGELEVEYDL